MASRRKKTKSTSARKSLLGDNPFSPTSSSSHRRAVLPTAASASQTEPSPTAPSKPDSKPEPSRSTNPPAAKRSKAKSVPPQPPPHEPSPSPPQSEHADASEKVAVQSPVPQQPTEPVQPAKSTPRAVATPPDQGVFGVARDMLSTNYYLRQWGRLSMRNRSEVVDDFGHDPKYDAKVAPYLNALLDRYFRADVEGVDNIPAQGRAVIVLNHSGTFAFDGPMLKTAVRRHHPQARIVRWLAEDHFFYLPFVGSFMNRIGAVRACPENATRLLKNEQLIAVFPEGVKGTGRLFRDRYRVQRFGRGGFVRLCLRTSTPIIPCALIGPEDSMPVIARVEAFANWFGVPYIPITPTFPWLGPFGVLPAPTKWKLSFGPAMSFDDLGPEAADDDVLVSKLTERVRSSIQAMIDHLLSRRRSVWFG